MTAQRQRRKNTAGMYHGWAVKAGAGAAKVHLWVDKGWGVKPLCTPFYPTKQENPIYEPNLADTGNACLQCLARLPNVIHENLHTAGFLPRELRDEL